MCVCVCVCVQPSYCVWLVYRVGKRSQDTVSSTKPDRCPYRRQLKPKPIINGLVCECTRAKIHTHINVQHVDLRHEIMLLRLFYLIAECAKHSSTSGFHIYNNQPPFTRQYMNHITSQRTVFSQRAKESLQDLLRSWCSITLSSGFLSLICYWTDNQPWRAQGIRFIITQSIISLS